MLEFITDKDKRSLLGQAEAGSVQHAYLFTGGDSATRREAILDFTALATSGDMTLDTARKRLGAGTFVDFYEVDGERGSVKIDQVRAAISFLMIVPVELDRRVVLINDAHTMTIDAQNALLLTLEEPPEDSLVILSASSSVALLDTIISRTMDVSLDESAKETESDDLVFLLGRLDGILSANDTVLVFSTAASLAKHKDNIEECLDGLLRHLAGVMGGRSGIQGGTGNSGHGLIDNLDKKCSYGFSRIVLDTMRYVKQNALVQLALEVMLIRMLEEYNAENSGHQI